MLHTGLLNKQNTWGPFTLQNFHAATQGLATRVPFGPVRHQKVLVWFVAAQMSSHFFWRFDIFSDKVAELVEWNSCRHQWVITRWTCCQSARCTAWDCHINKHYSCFMSPLSVSARAAHRNSSHTGEPSFLLQPGGSSAALSPSATYPSLANQHSTAGVGSFPRQLFACIRVWGPSQVCPASPLVSRCDGEEWLPRRQALPPRLCRMNRRGDVSAKPPPRCLRWTSCLQSCWRSSSHICAAVSHVSWQRLWSPCEHLKAAGGVQLASGQQAVTSPCEESFGSTLSSFIAGAAIRLEHSLLFYRVMAIGGG